MSENHDKGLRILIIEDDVVDKKLLERLLTLSTLSVSVVKSVGLLKDALDMVQSETFDVVLSDLGLPDSVGTNVVEKLHSVAPHVPVIIMSGQDDEAIAIQAVQLGAQDYLIKGQVDGPILVRAIRYAVERKRAENKLQEAEANYRVIFENSAVAIMLANAEGQLISWNQFTADLLEMTEEDLYLRPIKAFYPDQEWQKICDQNVRLKGMQHHLETRMLKKTGKLIDVDISLTVLKDAEDRMAGSIGVIRDITERKEAEKQLDQSCALLHATLESTADGLLAVDNEGRFTVYNQKFSSMWGVSEETLAKTCFGDLVTMMDEQLLEGGAFLHDLKTTGTSRTPPMAETHGILVFKDGRIYEQFSKPQYVAEQVTGQVLSFRDVTERKQAELALLKSEERFRQVVENAQEWIWEVDAQGLFTYVSPVVEKILGYKIQDLLDKTYFYDLFAPDQRESLKKKSFEVFARKDRFRQFETKIQDINGNTVWLSKSGVPLLDERGELLGYRGVDVDISERKRVHEILNRKQKNLEAIFDAAPIGMLLIGSNMRVRRANDAARAMAFKEYVDIINQHPGYVMGCVNASKTPKNGSMRCGDSPSCMHCQFFGTIRTSLDENRSIHGVELNPQLNVNGKVVTPWLSLSTEVVTIDGDHCVVAAINDITDRVHAERELRDTMEIKSQFISTVSHELRTPLAAMKEAVMIVLDEVAGNINNDQKHFLGVARRNIDRLWRLINDVLDFQKLGAGKMVFQMAEGNLIQTVEEVYHTMMPLAKKFNVHMTLEIQPDAPMAVFDSDRMIQALTNLTSNAIKFTPENGQVMVGAKCTGNEFVLTVKDTGLGIPKEDLAKVFDRFYRVNRPGKQITGTGLGLAIVHRIVEAHNGRIEVQSEVDKGTAFVIHMPIKNQQGFASLSDTQDRAVEEIIQAS
ncbi:MAG: PAS domain S-box protein [Phycisphaerae bacterium]|nr:PAS domain S-box protein [Phycisphaerae bacterium]